MMDEERAERHDQRTAVVMLSLLGVLALFVVGVQIGIRHGKFLAGRVPEGGLGVVEYRNPSEGSPATPGPAGETADGTTLSSWVREEMVQDCDEQQLAGAIMAARQYRETATSGQGSLAYRQVYGLAGT